MSLKGLNHPGVDMVEHMRETGMDKTAIGDIITQRYKTLKSEVDKLDPLARLPAQIFELNTLEVAQAYNGINDLGNPVQLRKLQMAKQGLSPQGKELSSAFHMKVRKRALCEEDLCLSARNVKVGKKRTGA